MSTPLAQAYAESHPQQVAQQLDQFPATEVMEFLYSLEPRVMAPVIRHLSTNKTKSILQSMDAKTIATLLSNADHDDSLIIISCLANERYQEIIDASADEAGLRARLYGYSSLSVGAFANPQFITAKKGQLVSGLIKEFESELESQDIPIFIVENGFLLGQLPTFKLFTTKHYEENVENLMEQIQPLRATTNISTALNANQWLDHHTLPVVDKNNILIGVVTRKHLQHTTTHQSTNTPLGVDEIAAQLAVGYFDTCANLLNILVREPK